MGKFTETPIDIELDHALFICRAIGISNIQKPESRTILAEALEKITQADESSIKDLHTAIGYALFNDFLISSIETGLMNDPAVPEEIKKEFEELIQNEAK